MMPVASTAQAANPAAFDARLPAAIMLGGSLNGLAVRIVEELAANGFTSLSLGIGPFQLIALLVAARLCLSPDASEHRLPGWLHAAAVVLLLVPSSSFSWLVVALYAAAQACAASGRQRTGAAVFLAVALCAIWSSVALKWLAAPVTAAEAYVVGQLVGLVRPDIVQSGNVIGIPDQHNLVLMTACTTADALPWAALALVSVALLLGNPEPRRTFAAVAILAVAYALANAARLGAMSWSGDMYALIHGPIGRNVFDLLQTVAVLGLGSWASRP
ncbi:MAG: hypothetical protein SFW09_09685 [Hyphomicrobiaceae bacterium]|nr:hypothetical protein [Hyphomicrobiaceae bacterium]